MIWSAINWRVRRKPLTMAIMKSKLLLTMDSAWTGESADFTNDLCCSYFNARTVLRSYKVKVTCMMIHELTWIIQIYTWWMYHVSFTNGTSNMNSSIYNGCEFMIKFHFDSKPNNSLIRLNSGRMEDERMQFHS